MTRMNRSLICIAAALLVCLLAVGTVSAYDPDTACTSLKEVIAGSGDLMSIELIFEYSDESISYLKIRTDGLLNVEGDMSTNLQKRLLTDDDGTRTLSRVILTTVEGDYRISYILSPEKSVFKELPEAIEFPALTGDDPESITTDALNVLRYDYSLTHQADKTLKGAVVTHWARSDTSPSTTLPFMAAETRIMKKVGLHWDTYRLKGSTLNNVPNIYAEDVPATLPSGTYKQTAHCQGNHVDGVPYSWDYNGPQFTI